MPDIDAALAQMDESLGIAASQETPAETPEAQEQRREENLAALEQGKEQPRDEKGRFVSVETDDPDVQAVLEKYQGDPVKALKAAAEAQKLIGSQGKELGELRQLIEERLPAEEEPSLDINQGTVDWFDEQIDANPQGAAAWALQNDPTGTLYDRAMDAWYEMPGQARRAAQFERAMDAQKIQELVREQTAPLAEQQSKMDLAAALDRAKQLVPELVNYGEAIVQEAKDSPEILLAAKTQEEKVQAILKLHRLVRGGQIDSLQDATAQNQQAETEQARDAKLSGHVATQSQTFAAEQVSEEEQWLRDNLDPYLSRFQG